LHTRVDIRTHRALGPGQSIKLDLFDTFFDMSMASTYPWIE
jgi:hypothetical protein